jgi:hypothetical protein
VDSLLNAHYALHPVADLRRPQVADICHMQVFSDVLNLPISEAPSGDKVVAESFSAAFEALPGLEDEWRSQCRAHLESLVAEHLQQHTPTKYGRARQKSLPSTPSTNSRKSPLDLAVACFKCRECVMARWLDAEEILEHRCPLTRRLDSVQNPSSDVVAARHSGFLHWNQEGCVVLHVRAAKTVTSLLDACNLDASNATSRDLYEFSTGRIFCETCSLVSGFRFALVLRQGVSAVLSPVPHSRRAGLQMGHMFEPDHPAVPVLTRFNELDEREVLELEICVLLRVPLKGWSSEAICVLCT